MRANTLLLLVAGAAFTMTACGSSTPSAPSAEADAGVDAEPATSTSTGITCTSPNAVPRKENGECGAAGEYGMDPAQTVCCIPCKAGEVSAQQAVPTCVAGDAGSSGTGDKVQAYCDAVASHGTCPGKSPQPCSTEGKCIYGQLMSPAGAAAYNTCFASPSCKSDDACANAGGQAAGGAAATAYPTNCAQKLAACPGIGQDYCAPAVYAYTGIGEAMTACLAKPCGELAACFAAGVKPIADCKK